MASRRPTSRAAKPPSNLPNAPLPPTATKIRSTTSKTTPRPPDDTQDQSHATYKYNKLSGGQEDAESNIQVVIRCRGRSEREIKDNSPIIVSSNGAKSKFLSIDGGAPVSSLGVVQMPPLKTYAYDTVFGPEADQAMIYHEVVHPMLQEVLQGYNCTLFAYGQTGTGKTHTMQGDLAPTAIGNPSPNAGMIPRALFRLFHQLDKSKLDYSVKISCIELYNEELRDLLASDLPPPSGNTQPMGAGLKDTNKNQEIGLKIFDDSNKRGVVIQGLEEIPVKDSQDALALLMKGSMRRQIAATNFNDHSSRSHSIFSITVHIKETSSIGDDLLRVGKLNLVDLAGSENIGRSGAESKRAREAGMINQSLLTLGRVINALVDKAQHVPYRESKLTRLLQDSLGGHTKTCIIATISPTRSNMEETMSTLDYALRAKSIRNKPEVNQRMSRNALLKEYLAEIDRLKADVVATREKNGIYFSEEHWKQISQEQELLQTELKEAKKQVEIIEKDMINLREEYDQTIAMLKRREGELKETREKLSESEAQLARKDAELKGTQVALEEETVVRKAHQSTEIAIDRVAAGLKSIAKESLEDVSALFAKLARKQQVLSSNSQAVVTHGNTISTSTDTLVEKLSDYVKTAGYHVTRVQNMTNDFEAQELKSLTTRSKQIELQSQRLNEALALIQSKDSTETDILQTVQSTLTNVIGTLQTELVTWNESLQETFKKRCQEFNHITGSGFSALEDSLNTLGSLAESVVRDASQYIENERIAKSKTRTLAEVSSNTEVQRLKKQNQVLLNLLDNEKQKGEKSRQELLQRINGLLGDYLKERDTSLRLAVGLVQAENSQAEQALSEFSASHSQLIAASDGHAAELNTTLSSVGQGCKRTRDGALKSLEELQKGVVNNISDLFTDTSNSVGIYTGKVQQHTGSLSATCDTAFKEHTRVKKARIEVTSSLDKDIQADYSGMAQGVTSSSHRVKALTDVVTSEATLVTGLTKAYHIDASEKLQAITGATTSLSYEGTKDDVSLGLTPRKQVRKYVDEWELTRPRGEILKAWRKQLLGAANGVPSTENQTTSEDDDDESDMIHKRLQSSTPELTTPSESPGSLTSSLSSTISIPSTIPTTRPLRTKGIKPSITTLLDTKNVHVTRGSRRMR
ncbi:hypothetical protein AMATHDRAFT_186247 [Amanita thiersii Skay4041]|uniref:Kinesin motor domain-containing protein n=1 Tax=Amanita thiersii Skay4041 TaxID=703135 RepID=A0A2A9NTN1_9AGAR|nr:hypothetical protein AMATHDRAFT_186247 [Amanita thiersii Skay4041]